MEKDSSELLAYGQLSAAARLAELAELSGRRMGATPLPYELESLNTVDILLRFYVPRSPDWLYGFSATFEWAERIDSEGLLLGMGRYH